MDTKPLRVGASLCLAALLILAGCGGCASRPVVVSEPRADWNLMILATVRIETWCDGEPVSLGSGVAVGRDRIATVAHVIDATGDCEFQIVRHDGARTIGLVTWRDDAADAAAVRTVDAAFFSVWAEIATGRPDRGGEVCGYGWDRPDFFGHDGLGWWENPVLKCGIVTHIDERTVVSSMHVVKGNSGSGYWYRGQLLAVVSQGNPYPDRDNWGRGPVVARFAHHLLGR